MDLRMDYVDQINEIEREQWKNAFWFVSAQ